jgi:hypothetical protein
MTLVEWGALGELIGGVAIIVKRNEEPGTALDARRIPVPDVNAFGFLGVPE